MRGPIPTSHVGRDKQHSYVLPGNNGTAIQQVYIEGINNVSFQVPQDAQSALCKICSLGGHTN